MHKHLFIPGPVEVRPDVLQAMAKPMISHRGPEVSDLQKSISDRLRQLLKTDQDIVLSTSSGSGLMEGAIRSCTRQRAVVFSVGAFGDRWHQMAQANGVPADLVSFEPGRGVDLAVVDKTLASGRYDVATITHNETSTGVMNPLAPLAAVFAAYPELVWLVDAVSSLGGVDLPVQQLGIDVLIGSSQKCLGLPPGLSLCTVSEKALQAARQVPHRGLYFDLLTLVETIRQKNHQYPSTPSLSHLFALDYQLDRILAEGPERRYRRHQQLAEHTQAWARDRFALFADEAVLSPTVTCLRNTRSLDVAALNAWLGQRGYLLSNGYGALRNQTFRIAHMADTSLADLDGLLSLIDDYLNETGA